MGKSYLDRRLHECGVTENHESIGTDEPEDGRDWGRDEAQGNTDTNEGRVKLRRGQVDWSTRTSVVIRVTMRAGNRVVESYPMVKFSPANLPIPSIPPTASAMTKRSSGLVMSA